MRNRIDIAVSVEHLRGWGRRVCEGISDYLHGCPQWHLSMFEEGLPAKAVLNKFDGFLWCIADERTAYALKATGRPVVSFFDVGTCGGIAYVGADHAACGEHILNLRGVQASVRNLIPVAGPFEVPR